MNIDKLGPLPPDCLGNTHAPKIIIRQVGLSYYIHILKESVTFKLFYFNDNVLNLFDGKETLYLYEPDAEKKEPFYKHGIPTLATCSPDDSRYKEFVKNGGEKLFMPCLTLDELLCIGKFLVKEGDLSNEMKELYSDKKITERFNEFGGIYRNVLPSSLRYESYIKLHKFTVISDLTKETVYKLLASANIENPDISHLLAQFDVKKEGKDAFKKYTMQFVGDNIPKDLQSKLELLTFEETRHLLVRADETGFLDVFARDQYEKFIVKYHLQGFEADTRSSIIETTTTTKAVKTANTTTNTIKAVKTKTTKAVKTNTTTTTPSSRNDDNNTTNQWISKYVISKNQFKLAEGDPPIFKDMTPGILYYSLNPVFPLADIMYMTTDSNNKSELCAVQVSREKGNRNITEDTASLFLNLLGLEDFSNVKYYYFSRPSNVEKVKIIIPSTLKFKDVQIVKVPLSYDFKKVPRVVREIKGGTK